MRSTRRLRSPAGAGLLAALALLALAHCGRPEAAGAPGRRLKREPVVVKPWSWKRKPFERECLAAHNKWRRLHGADDLKLDSRVAAFARKRAEFIAKSDGAEFRHPPDLPYGENLAWHSRNTTSCSELVKMWYNEEPQYNYNRPGFTHATGHFSQLVWRETRRLGCAGARSKGPRGGIYLVCNYDPPGNVIGAEAENVLPKGGSRVGVTSSAEGAVSVEVSTPAARELSTAGATTEGAPGAAQTPTAKPKRDKKKKRPKGKKKKKKKKEEEEEEEERKREKKKSKKKKKGKKKATTTTTSPPPSSSSSSTTTTPSTATTESPEEY